MVINDHPLDLEMKKGKGYSSPSASMFFSELDKVGISRTNIHATYLFYFRPIKGDVSSLFYHRGLPKDKYISWNEKNSILSYVYKDLKVLRDEIKEVDPDLIICTGKWGLYFLSGETAYTETTKSKWGTLLKWRASHLALSSFWNRSKPHVLIPVLNPTALWDLPKYSKIIKQDYKRVGLLAGQAIKGKIKNFTVEGRGYQFTIKPSFQEVKDFLVAELLLLDNSVRYYSIDVETKSGFHDCIGIAVSETRSICIPWATLESPHYWTEQEEQELQYLLRLFLTHKKCRHIGQNYSFDIQYLERDLLIEVLPSFDTMVCHHTLFAGLDKNLAFLASLYTQVYRYWKDELKTAQKDAERWTYNCKDTCLTYEIYSTLKVILSKSPTKIQKAFHTQMYDTLPALINIMKRGVAVNTNEQYKFYDEFVLEMQKIKSELDFILDRDFNPSSSVQKSQLLYKEFGLPIVRHHKTHKLTTNADALKKLTEEEPLIKPVADRLSEYGNLKTFSSTFLNAELDYDKRMRTSYNIGGTDTFRLASSQNAFNSGMNLQNVPSGGTTILGRILPNCRALFIPDKGFTFFDIDLDSADLRIVVAESGASGLQQMLDEGYKPYVQLMKEYYKDPTKSKHSKEYKTFKGFCHGSNYLGSPAGLASSLGLLVHEVDKLYTWYFLRNPEIGKWHKKIKNQINKRGWIENIFGYRKYIFDKKAYNYMNMAIAWIPQSTIALLINKGMVNIDQAYIRRETPVRINLQVHDSLAGQYPTNKPECKKAIIDYCTIDIPYPTSIRIPVDINTSIKSWGDCK